MRADARKNREALLDAARGLLTADGAEASLRDVARSAGVGLGTLYRHFPTREALLEALLRDGFDRLAARAKALAASPDPADALRAWVRETVAVAHDYEGAIRALVAALADEGSALHAACVQMKAAGTRLLERAQARGQARPDMDGADLFALIGALAWIADQPALASRTERLVTLVSDALLGARTTPPPPSEASCAAAGEHNIPS